MKEKEIEMLKALALVITQNAQQAIAIIEAATTPTPVEDEPEPRRPRYLGSDDTAA
jgi:hypothetical protein